MSDNPTPKMSLQALLNPADPPDLTLEDAIPVVRAWWMEFIHAGIDPAILDLAREMVEARQAGEDSLFERLFAELSQAFRARESAIDQINSDEFFESFDPAWTAGYRNLPKPREQSRCDNVASLKKAIEGLRTELARPRGGRPTDTVAQEMLVRTDKYQAKHPGASDAEALRNVLKGHWNYETLGCMDVERLQRARGTRTRAQNREQEEARKRAQ